MPGNWFIPETEDSKKRDVKEIGLAIGSRFFNMGRGRTIERGPKYALSPAQIPGTRWKNNNVAGAI